MLSLCHYIFTQAYQLRTKWCSCLSGNFILYSDQGLRCKEKDESEDRGRRASKVEGSVWVNIAEEWLLSELKLGLWENENVFSCASCVQIAQRESLKTYTLIHTVGERTRLEQPVKTSDGTRQGTGIRHRSHFGSRLPARSCASAGRHTPPLQRITNQESMS